MASSFEDFLEQLRNDLLSAKFEFVDGCGIVEGTGTSRAASRGESKSSGK